MKWMTRLLVCVLVSLGSLSAQSTESITIGDRKFEVRRYRVAKGQWSEQHIHRGMVLVLTSSGEHFEEDLREPGTFLLREEQLRVKNNSAGHRLGAIHSDMEVVEVELELPSQNLQPRAHKDSRIFIAGLKIQRTSTAQGTCIEFSQGSDSATLCTSENERSLARK